jgi:ASC-1-like (ASCH) protein
MVHVAVIQRHYLELILAGRKTAELRLTRHRTAPHGLVGAGQRLYFKQSSGPVRATAVVTVVESFESLTPRGVRALETATRATVLGRPEFFRERAQARYASVIHFTDVRPCAYGPDFSAQRAANPRGAWLILPAQADVYPDCIDRGLLTL